MRSPRSSGATRTSISLRAWAPPFPLWTSSARTTGSLYAGKDGKTGETLLKTVLAPMFAARNLKVMSWVGHNIFGNRDGLVLDDPANKSSKVETKDRVLYEILGYRPSSVVTIEYLPDMGDWKTAWDHIHFQGFLGTKMRSNSPGKGATACWRPRWPLTWPALPTSKSNAAARD